MLTKKYYKQFAEGLLEVYEKVKNLESKNDKEVIMKVFIDYILSVVDSNFDKRKFIKYLQKRNSELASLVEKMI